MPDHIKHDTLRLGIFAAALAIFLSAVALQWYWIGKQASRIEKQSASIDSLKGATKTLRASLEAAGRENRRLRDVLNGQVKVMGKAITTETRRPAEQDAVAHVIRNRTESDQFPSMPSAVVREPAAFSGMPTHRAPAPTALRAAIGALLERTEDPTHGACYFYSPVSMRPRWSAPDWARDFEETEVEGISDARFRFFRGGCSNG